MFIRGNLLLREDLFVRGDLLFVTGQSVVVRGYLLFVRGNLFIRGDLLLEGICQRGSTMFCSETVKGPGPHTSS